jgi:membrane protein DedA with SNARE-associated domain
MVGGWVIEAVRTLGYVGIALLMCLENLFPPIPSELIMPLAGVLAAGGDITLTGAIAAGSVGSLVGQAGWYALGRRLGEDRVRAFVERHGRWVAVTSDDLDRSREWLTRHGALALIVGRLVPTIRTLISLPAGMARVPLWRFLVYSALGTTAWTAGLAVAGYALQSRFTRIREVMGPISTAVLAAMLVWYVWRVATYRRRGARRPRSSPTLG